MSRNPSYSTLFLSLLMISIAGFWGSACSTSSPSSSDASVESVPEGPSREGDKKIQIYGPEPLQLYPVALILGPGMAKSFAHAGILEALNEEKIPIGAIISTEMSAVIASVYSTSKTVNEFEWKLMKLNKDDLFDGGLSISLSSVTRLFGGKDSGSKLESKLKDVFGQKRLSDTQIPLGVGIMYQVSADDWQYSLVRKGDLAAVLRVALTYPDEMKVNEWSGFPAKTAALDRPFPVEDVRRLKVGPVISVKLQPVTGSGAEEVEQSELTIEPDVADIELMDFGKKSEAIYRGRIAAKEKIRQIRLLVGMPEHGM